MTAGINDEENQRGIVGTVLVETAHYFEPIGEFGTPEYWTKMYWTNIAVRKALGNITERDAVDYRGRGYIQLTGRNNYEKAAAALNLPLLSQPELLLTLDVSARVLIWFWKTHGLVPLCQSVAKQADPVKRDLIWGQVRRKVNGGTNNLGTFLKDLDVLQIR